MRDAPALPSGWPVPDWSVDARVRAFVTTRTGGVSEGPYASLDMGGASVDDLAQAVAENRRRVAQHLPASPTWLQQVHGADVVEVHAPPAHAASASPPVADAAVTRVAGVPLAVRVADCLPVFLAHREGTVIGIAHAGWRGLAQGVIERTLAAMQCPAQEIAAWIGPGIGARAFEVGDDVHAAFTRQDKGAAAHFAAHRAGKWHADLPALARRRLRAAGVSEVRGGDACTFEDAQRFFSYRRDGATGRMAAIIWLQPQASR